MTMLCLVHPLRHHGACGAFGGFRSDDGDRWQLTGEIDLATAQALRVACSALPGEQDVHVDLAGLTSIDVNGSARW